MLTYVATAILAVFVTFAVAGYIVTKRAKSSIRKMTDSAIKDARDWQSEMERRKQETKRYLQYKVNPEISCEYIGYTMNYMSILNRLQNYSFPALSDTFGELMDQERKMQFLYGEIWRILARVEIDAPEMIYEAMQRCLNAYSTNRIYIVNIIDRMRGTLSAEREHYEEQVCDIAKDNQQIIGALERFHAAISEYLAKANSDDTSIHVTDLSSVVELDKMTGVFERVVQDTEDEIKAGMASDEQLNLQVGGGH